MILPKIIGKISMGKTMQQSLPMAAAISALLMVSALCMSRVAAITEKVEHS